MSKTTILLENSTRQKLREIGRKEQTYDQVINELIKIMGGHFSAVKIQVNHLDHLFKIYIKALGNTICRVEEPKQPKKSVVEFLNDIFNPLERIQKQLTGISERLDKLASFQGPIDPIDNRGA
jgi:hypothetical protein